MNLVIGNEDTTGEWKTNIRGPLQCRGQCELFSILMHYVCIKGKGWMRVFFSYPPPLCRHARVCVRVRVLDSANSDLHFPWTACEMFSDMGSVTAIIYKAHRPPSLSPSPSQPNAGWERTWAWASKDTISGHARMRNKKVGGKNERREVEIHILVRFHV